jgi:hypothetical protein
VDIEVLKFRDYALHKGKSGSSQAEINRNTVSARCERLGEKSDDFNGNCRLSHRPLVSK